MKWSFEMDSYTLIILVVLGLLVWLASSGTVSWQKVVDGLLGLLSSIKK